jgi:CRISPR/Cas system CSM-associated protein Csm4 (group 5 of RAMP superfamily)
VDWTRGNYTLVTRAGRVASSGEHKKTAQLVAEGSVLFAASAPSGSARDVAPDGAAHPVFRAGFAVSVPLPEVG